MSFLLFLIFFFWPTERIKCSVNLYKCWNIFTISIEKNNIPYIETSAKLKINIDEGVSKVVNDAYIKLKEEYSEYGEKYRGIAKGKNVIIVQLEALQEFLYGLEINGEEVTPNLNKFLDENIHLKNMHAKSYTTTAD